MREDYLSLIITQCHSFSATNFQISEMEILGREKEKGDRHCPKPIPRKNRITGFSRVFRGVRSRSPNPLAQNFRTKG